MDMIEETNKQEFMLSCLAEIYNENKQLIDMDVKHNVKTGELTLVVSCSLQDLLL